MTDWFARPVLHGTDLEASLRFYVNGLGFTSPWRYDEDGRADVAQVRRISMNRKLFLAFVCASAIYHAGCYSGVALRPIQGPSPRPAVSPHGSSRRIQVWALLC